jgi:alpha-1,3-rhamnosyl/mannosyltransferase
VAGGDGGPETVDSDRFPCPAVVTVHDLIHLRFPEHRTALEIAYARRTVARALRSAARTLTVSEATRRELAERFGHAGARAVVVPNAVDERFRAEPPPAALAAAMERLGLAPGYLLFVGNPKPHKNLPALLAAYAELAARRSDLPPLLLAGGERDDAPAGGVRRIGVVAEGDLPALYRGARALVLPSLWEGFGLPALEAMASGTPVVAAARGALPELVGDAGLLFDPDDATALPAALARIVDDAALRAELARRGRERAAGYSWRETARATLAVYRDVLAGARGER